MVHLTLISLYGIPSKTYEMFVCITNLGDGDGLASDDEPLYYIDYPMVSSKMLYPFIKFKRK